MTIGYAVHVPGIPDPIAAFKHKDAALKWAEHLYHGRAKLVEIAWPGISVDTNAVEKIETDIDETTPEK